MKLPDVAPDDAPAAIKEVERRPIPIPESFPDSEVVVDCHRVGHVQSRDRLLDVRQVMFRIELRRVNPDDLESAPRVTLVDVPHRGNRAHAVDSPEGPKLDEHRASDERRRVASRCVQPSGALNRWCAHGGRTHPQQKDPRER